jgi:hypothetical protein
MTCQAVDSAGQATEIAVAMDRSNGWVNWTVIDWGWGVGVGQ